MQVSLFERDGTPRAVAVVGPTASGKTDFAIELCERYGGEVVGCDNCIMELDAYEWLDEREEELKQYGY